MKKILIAATALMLITTTSAFAGPRTGMGMGSGFGPGSCNISGLDLTTEQVEKVRAVRQAHMANMQDSRNQMFQKKAEIRLEWMQTTPDVDKIKKLQGEINDLRAVKQSMMVDQELEFRKILTPDQLTRYLAQGAGAGMGQGRGFGHCGRGKAMGQGAGRGMMGQGACPRTGRGMKGQGLGQANCPNAPAQQ